MVGYDGRLWEMVGDGGRWWEMSLGLEEVAHHELVVLPHAEARARLGEGEAEAGQIRSDPIG